MDPWMQLVDLGTDSSGRPLILDARTVVKLLAAQRVLGIPLTVVQGSYRGTQGAHASAGTHDHGGVIDIRTRDIPSSVGLFRVVLELRLAGLIAWHRTAAQGFDDHIHAVDHGNPALSPAAARQVTAWAAGRNGLKSGGPDDGPRVQIPQDPPEGVNVAIIDTDELREIVREELTRIFRDDSRDKAQLPDIGRARVVHPNNPGQVSTLGHLLFGIFQRVDK